MNKEKFAEEVRIMPKFCRGKYIVTNIRPPKDKGPEAALMVTLNLVSYEEEKEDGTWGEPFSLIEVSRTEEGQIVVEIPHGKNGIFGKMYSGPYGFRFKDKDSDKWFRVADEKYTREYFMEAHGDTYQTPEAFDQAFNEYLVELYNFRLSVNFDIDQNVEIGMFTTFYRSVGKKKEGQKWPDIYLNKHKKDYPSLDSSFELVGEDVVEAIIETLTSEGPTDVPF